MRQILHKDREEIGRGASPIHSHCSEIRVCDALQQLPGFNQRAGQLRMTFNSTTGVGDRGDLLADGAQPLARSGILAVIAIDQHR
jgi:hypothetical protein